MTHSIHLGRLQIYINATLSYLFLPNVNLKVHPEPLEMDQFLLLLSLSFVLWATWLVSWITGPAKKRLPPGQLQSISSRTVMFYLAFQATG